MTGRIGGAMLIEIPICPNEEPTSRVKEQTRARKRSFIFLNVIVEGTRFGQPYSPKAGDLDGRIEPCGAAD